MIVSFLEHIQRRVKRRFIDQVIVAEVSLIVVRQVGKNLNRLELPEFASVSRILDFFAVLVDAVFDVLDSLLSVSESDYRPA